MEVRLGSHPSGSFAKRSANSMEGVTISLVVTEEWVGSWEFCS